MVRAGSRPKPRVSYNYEKVESEDQTSSEGEEDEMARPVARKAPKKNVKRKKPSVARRTQYRDDSEDEEEDHVNGDDAENGDDDWSSSKRKKVAKSPGRKKKQQGAAKKVAVKKRKGPVGGGSRSTGRPVKSVKYTYSSGSDQDEESDYDDDDDDDEEEEEVVAPRKKAVGRPPAKGNNYTDSYVAKLSTEHLSRLQDLPCALFLAVRFRGLECYFRDVRLLK